MLTCREVAAKVARDEFAGAPWRARLALRVHLLFCRHCRRYQSQLRVIGEASRDLWGPSPQPPEASQQLERQILERCLGPTQKRDKPHGDN